MSQSAEDSAVGNLQAFIAAGAGFQGTPEDQAFAREMSESPPLPPSVSREAKSAVMARLRSSHGEQNLQQIFLFGSPDELSGAGECTLVTYQGLLSGGLAGCLEPDTGEVLALWLIPEG